MSAVEFRTLLQVNGAAEESALTQFAIQHLRERGYYVTQPGEPWERPCAFCKRVGIYPHRLGGIVDRFHALGGDKVSLLRRGKSERIMRIQSHPRFDEFCRSLRGRRSINPALLRS